MTVRRVTPWEHLVTKQPKLFAFSRDSNTVSAYAGEGQTSAWSLLTLRGMPTIRQDELLIKPYRLALAPWKSHRPPILSAHPFLLIHLLATGQVERQDIMPHLGKLDGTLVATIAITQPCVLLSQLQRPRAALRLATDFNLTGVKR